MSDSDDDWEEDEPVAPQPQAAEAQFAYKPTAATTPAVASPSAASGGGVVPNVLLALPITLALKEHPALAAGIPAGITLLYDPAKGDALTLLAYDQHKRPMLLEVLSGAKLLKPSLPLSLTLGDGEGNAMHQSTLVDSQARKWTTSFGAPHEAARMACNIGVATLTAKAASNCQFNQIFVKHDLSKGAGKSAKPKTFVSLQVRAWVCDLTTDASARGTAALARVTASTSITSFNPDVTIGGSAAPGAVPFTEPVLNTTIGDVEVAEESSATLVCPATLGDALTGGKLKSEGGSRLLILPASADLALEVMKDSPLPRGGHGSILLLQLTPLSVSKKREKKEKAAKKEKSSSKAIAEEDETPASPISSASAIPSDSSSSSSLSFQSWSSSLSATLAPLMSNLQAMNDQVSGTAATQQKIVKFLMSELYEGLVTELGLQAALDAQSAEPDADNPTPEVDPAQAAQLVAVQTRVRALVSGFVEKNSVEHKGTLASLVNAWKAQLLPTLQPLVNPTGLLSESQLSAVAAAAAAGNSAGDADKLKSQVAKLTASHAAQQKKLEDANRLLQEQLAASTKKFADLDSKHTSLVMTHIDLEERAGKLEAANSDLTKKAAMCTVFEAGLTDMRSMLEAEIEAKQQLQLAWEQLSSYQKAYKLTWVPDKGVTNCMRCASKFSLFGASKGHCRYCGRVFCRDCTTQQAIPEFGFAKKVKICKPCCELRGKVAGERAAEEAAENAPGSDDEDDEDIQPRASAAAATASPRNKAPQGKQQQQGQQQKPVLMSFSDDEDDL